MSKATSTPEVQPQDPKRENKFLRETLPWMLVVAFTFASVGLISGWMFRSNVITSNQAAIVAASKEQSR